MIEKVSRPEDMIRRFNLWLLALAALAGLAAIVFVLPHGRPEDMLPRIAVPVSVIASSIVAAFLMRRGYDRLGAGLVIGAAYLTLLYYVIAGSYGLRSYALVLYAVLIVATALMIGHRAGLAACAIAIVTSVLLFWLERRGGMIHAEAALSIPLPNILLVYVILYGTIGFVLYVFSKSYRETLRAVDMQGQHLQQLIELAPQGYALHRDGKILMFNRAAAAAAGIDPQAAVGGSFYHLIPVEHRALVQENMGAASALAPGASLAVEYSLRDATGRERLLATWTTPVALVDGPALLTIARDITEERAATAGLAAAKAEAEAANRAKSQFLANMSHEIRTPMNAVLGLSELLLASEMKDEQRERAQGIRSSAQALLHVINDVLDVSRIEAGKADLVEAVFDPRGLLDEVRAMLLPLAAEKGLSFDVRVAADVPALMEGDAGRLRQILVNLAGNAIKFTLRGRVGIEAGVVPARADGFADADTKGWTGLHLRVVDSGPGIAPEQIGTLFERFVQADASDTRRHGGAGLGLYIAREFARMMGGDIEVESVLGMGSRFDVTVRLRRPTAVAAWGYETARLQAQRPAPVRPAASLAVLLAEDNEINQTVARSMLEAAGHRVTVAVDGAQAVASCAAQVFDCVLMDCQMPVMDGVEATRRIRAHEAETGRPKTPIIALTANAMRGDRERYLAAGMDGFLAKPFDGGALLAVVAQSAGVAAPPAAAGAPLNLAQAPTAAVNPPAPGAGAGGSAWFDPSALLQLTRLDRDSPGLLHSLVGRFLSNTPELIAQIAGAALDAGEMERAAHSLKSTCARFGAPALAALALQAEAAAQAGDLAGARRIGRSMREEFSRFEPAFRGHPAVAALG